MSKGNKLSFYHRIDLKQQNPRDVGPLILRISIETLKSCEMPMMRYTETLKHCNASDT